MTKEIKQGKKKKKVDLSAERKRLQAEGVLPPWYTTAGWQMFKSKYLYQAANVKEQFQRIARTAAVHLPLVFRKEAEDKFFNMMWDGVLSCSTPVLSNTGTDRGLPVSCQGADFGDSVIEFFETRKDLAIHTKKGFGTSGYLGDVRPRGSPISTGGTAEGVLPLLTGMTDDNRYISQGNTRRGAFAGYTNLSGGDFDEIVDHVHAFPEDINIGWNVTEEEIQQIFSAKGLNREMKRRWAKSLKLKMNKGKGYYLKTTTANKYTTEAIRRAGRPIKASNLCSEIMLPSDEEYNFVCVLSSMNLIHWDRLKVSDDIFWATVFLACINKEFIAKAKGVRGLEKSVKFAEDYAAVGLGALGFHSLLQKNRLPFGSFEAHMLNNEIFDRIEEESERANRWLAEVLGENKFTEYLGVHCAAVRAIAPTKSTASIMGGYSEGINPDASMVFLQSTAAGEVYRINPFLLEIMKERGVYTQAEVDRIGALGGSVQSCDWLTDHEKEVFRTAYEINMLDHLRLCSQRQRRIDQGQSINLFLPGDADPAWIMKVHKYAMMDEYIKSLYYIYSTRMIQGLNKECAACS